MPTSACCACPTPEALAPEATYGVKPLRKRVEALQSRHYEGKAYDDAQSAAHLDAYIDALDPQKMFFTREDVEGFQTWRTQLDDLGREGDLAPAFSVFERYQQNLTTRLGSVVENLPEIGGCLRLHPGRYLPLNGDDVAWAGNTEGTGPTGGANGSKTRP